MVDVERKQSQGTRAVNTPLALQHINTRARTTHTVHTHTHTYGLHSLERAHLRWWLWNRTASPTLPVPVAELRGPPLGLPALHNPLMILLWGLTAGRWGWSLCKQWWELGRMEKNDKHFFKGRQLADGDEACANEVWWELERMERMRGKTHLWKRYMMPITKAHKNTPHNNCYMINFQGASIIAALIFPDTHRHTDNSHNRMARTVHTYCTWLGLARTVYTHRIWPYIWWFPCQKYHIYTVYIWFWPTQYMTIPLVNFLPKKSTYPVHLVHALNLYTEYIHCTKYVHWMCTWFWPTPSTHLHH